MRHSIFRLRLSSKISLFSRAPILALGLLIAAGSSGLRAENASWPTWRGAGHTGVVEGAKPPLEWSESKNIRYKVKIPGVGHSTPVIWGDRIFLTTAIDTKKPAPGAKAEPEPEEEPREGRRRRGGRRGGFGRGSSPKTIHEFVVLCLDRKTGDEIWRKTVHEEVPHEGHHRDHGFSSSSPLTDGELLFAHFGSRGLYCLDLDGEVKWSRDLGDMSTRNGFGEGSSPALHGDVLVVNWDHEGPSSIVALDKKTGEPIWKKDRDEKTSWVTPVIVEVEGRAQVIVNGTNRAIAYDLKDGSVIWECRGQTANVIPTPVVGHGLVYLMSGFRGNKLQAVRLAGARGDVTESSTVVWDHDRGTPYVPSPVLYGDQLYFLKGNNAILSCHDAKTGKPLFAEQRLEGLRGVYASPVGADGRIYIVGRDGKTAVLKHGPELEILRVNELDEGIDASPAVVGSQLFLRGASHLYCIENR